VTSNVRVIAAVPEHADVLAQLHATSFPAPWSEEDFAQFLRQPGMRAWVAGHNKRGDTKRGDAKPGDAAGFILTRRVAEEAEVLTIAVEPDARKRGLGRALLARALDELRTHGVASVFLEVAVKNTAAQALYRALGFTACGTRHGYYESGQYGDDSGDATVMRLDL
jgi:ribosomal-protein-alanine N-acetyltransferase